MNPTSESLRYPWQSHIWARLWPPDRLGHALLFSGPRGVGKRALATFATHTLLCPSGSHEGPCRQCKSCHLTQTGANPDLFIAAPPEAGKAIGIEQVRSLTEFMTLKPHSSVRKVAFVADADALSLNAANALLKTLEEPPPDCYLILVTDRPQTLPSTLRSRCARFTLGPPDHQEALAWLKEEGHSDEPGAETALSFSGGAPLRAKALLAQEDFLIKINAFEEDIEVLREQYADVVTVAARWKKGGAGLAVEWLQRRISALIYERMTKPKAPGKAYATRLQERAQALDLKTLFRFSDTLSETARLVGQPVDELLLLEDLLVNWIQLGRQRTI
ncbi:MAG: DNA polymerase III subunit delta' [Acidiferrobacteraceae bacterium]